MPQTAVRTGVTLYYEITGEGEPVLLIMGTSGSLLLWGEVAPRLAQEYQVIAFDNRGLGGSERGEGQITVASLAEDASALLEALEIPRAHALGWSLGSAIIQELGLAHPGPVGQRDPLRHLGTVRRFPAGHTHRAAAPLVHRGRRVGAGRLGTGLLPSAARQPRGRGDDAGTAARLPPDRGPDAGDDGAVGRRPGPRHAGPAGRHQRSDHGRRR